VTDTLTNFSQVQEEFKRFRFLQPGFTLSLHPLDPILYGLAQFDETEREEHDRGVIARLMVETYDTYTYREPGTTSQRPIQMPAYEGMTVSTITMPRVDFERDRLNPRITIEHRRIMPLPMPREFLFTVLRQFIHSAVTHEADEWIRVDGEMKYDPHKGERS
jgi:hypothetical protein